MERHLEILYLKMLMYHDSKNPTLWSEKLIDKCTYKEILCILQYGKVYTT